MSSFSKGVSSGNSDAELSQLNDTADLIKTGVDDLNTTSTNIDANVDAIKVEADVMNDKLDSFAKGNTMSTANSTVALLAAGATFTGEWEDVVNYTTVATAILGSVPSDGTLWFDLSTDNGVTFTSVPSDIGDTTFAVPRILNVVEDYVRIRYVNGTTAMTGTFNIRTKYSNGQPISLLAAVDGFISGETPTQVVRAVVVGVNPEGNYENEVTAGKAFVTTSNLASAATFDSGILDLAGYSQVQGEVNSSHDGTLEFMFYNDEAGTDLVRELSIPYVAAHGYQLYSAPAFGYYARYRFTNTSASTQTDFFYTVKFLTSGLSPQILAKDGFIASSMVANLVRPASDFNEDRNISLVGGQVSKRIFGINSSVGGSPETIWAHTTNWVPAQVTNQKLRIKLGGSVLDTAAGTGARSVRVNFLDENWEEVEETLTTNGALASTATTANCTRLNFAEVIDVGTYHGANAAAIVLELTGGVVMGAIATGRGALQKAIYSVPAGNTAYITNIMVSVGQGDSGTVRLFAVQNANDLVSPFGSKRIDWAVEDLSGAQSFKLDTHLKFDAYSDIWFEGEKITGGGNARMAVEFDFYTVEN